MDIFVALVGEKDSMNRAFARRIGPTFVGCQSHRFDLAVQEITRESEGVMGRAHELMTELSHQTPAAKQRRLTPLRPRLINNTRWSTVHETLKWDLGIQ